MNSGLMLKKTATEKELSYQGKRWLWVSYAPEYRLILSIIIGQRTQAFSDQLIYETISSLAIGIFPIFVSDGLDHYGVSLLAMFHIVRNFEKTGQRGRPRKPKLLPLPELKYAQYVKERENNRVVSVSKRIVYGDSNVIPDKVISTSKIERQNLNLRNENRRLTRKTLAFSKSDTDLKYHRIFYKAYSNLVRANRALYQPIDEQVKGKVRRKWLKRTPAMSYGIADHVWSLKELLTYRIKIMSTN